MNFFQHSTGKYKWKCVLFPHFAFLLSLILLNMLCASPAGAQSARKTVTVELRNATAVELVTDIMKNSGIGFSYRVEDLSAIPARDYSFRGATIDNVMSVLLKGTDLEWSQRGDTIVILQGTRQQTNNINVEGVVLNADGSPCAGATVMVKGTDTGVSTDASGRFRLTVPPRPSIVLVFSYVGMKTQEIPYTGTPLRVTMQTEEQKIDAVVVTGIFERPKEGFTGGVTVVSRDEILALAPNNVLDALTINDPSFRMNVNTLSGSNPTAIPDYQLRGQASIDVDYTASDAVVLRGDYNSRPNQPLFVLDGIIGVDVTSIMDLDPEQVQSITLLKDAAATVIYGSDAANGVVVVETRRPQPGEIRITYNGNYGISIPDLSDYNLVNSAEKLRIEEMAGVFNGNELSLNQYHSYLQQQVAKGVETDWIAKPVRNAFTHRHGLNFEGGNQSFRYKVYLGASFQPGVMKNTSLNTQNARVDLQYRMGKFMIMNQTYMDYGKGIRESDYGSFELYTQLNPYLSPYDENGNILRILDYIDPANKTGVIYNPLYNTLIESRNEVRDFTVKEALKLRYSPAENLRLELDFTISKTNERVEVFKPAKHTSMGEETDPAKMGSFTKQDREAGDWRVSLTASYNKLFGGHMISLYGRYSLTENKYNLSSTTMTGFPNDKLSEIFMGTTFKSITGDENTVRKMSSTATANYSYKSRYAVDLSGSIDGSSQFGRNYRYAAFWSTGVKWNLHNEEFIRRSDLFDELVLRASYGITGSNSFSSYQALQMYTYSGLMTEYVGSDVLGTEIYVLGNPDLKWQQTDTYNAAFEFGILKGILSGRVEYYYKYTKNTLLDFSLAPSIGFETVKDNLGSISNRGMEFTLRLTPYRNDGKQAYWNIIFNAARNKSRIEQISDALRARNEEVYVQNADLSYDYDLTRPLPQYVDGQSMTAIWGMKSAGIDPSTGREIYYTRDGGTTAVWSSNNVVVIGDMEPELSGSISTQFGYRNLSLTVAAQYTIGGDIYNTTLADKIENANLRYNVDKRVLYERWQQPGDHSKFKRLDAYGVETNATSRFVMRNDEIRVSTINLSYRFNDTDHGFMRSLGLSNMTAGLYFTDVLRTSTIRMERGINYPFAHQISMSLNISF